MTRSDLEPARVRPSVVDAHRADRAHPADIQRAYLRFTWARRKAPAKLSVVRWLAAGVAIGLGVASAATLLPPPRMRSATRSDSAEVAAPAKLQSARRAARSSAIAEPAPTESLPAESLLPVSEQQPPPRPSNSPPSAAAPRLPALPSATSTTSASDWQRAAAALREGDLPAAEAALAQLEQSASLRDRQAAELARAQLLVGRGRGADATPTLQRLAREGESPVVRSQAASLLQSLAN